MWCPHLTLFDGSFKLMLSSVLIQMIYARLYFFEEGFKLDISYLYYVKILERSVNIPKLW